MSHHHDLPNHPFCRNCYYPIAALENHCPQCGQKPTTGKVTIHDLLHELVHTTLHLDGRFLTTVRDLLVPAKLTTDFFKGHHVRFAHPIPMVLVLSSFCFFFISLLSHHQDEQNQHAVRMVQMSYHKQEYAIEFDSISKRLIHSVDDEEGKKAIASMMDSVKKTFKLVGSGAKKDTVSFQLGGGKPILQISTGEPKSKSDSISKIDLTDKKKPSSAMSEFEQGYRDAKKGIDDAKAAAPTNEPKHEKESLFDILTSIFNDNKKTRPDSIERAGTLISIRDYNNMTSDEIVEHYHVEGFTKRLVTKQKIKLEQEGGDFNHFLSGKVLLMSLAMIPFMALIMRLLYRKKWYYVEHLIFLTHFYASGFLIISATLMMSYFIPHDLWIHKHFLSPMYKATLLSIFVFLFLAFKRFYQQSWAKTALKYFLFLFSYMFFFLLFLTITLFISAAIY
jgi:hypothetical protein